MVFVVGAQRSGTNWLQRMIGAHPSVVCLPSETHLFTERVDAAAGQVQHGVLGSSATGYTYMDRDAYLDALRTFYDAVFGAFAANVDPPPQRIVERSPNHVEHLERVGEVYPDAWVVHIIRDGRDVSRSLVSQPWGPTSVGAAAEVWARSMRSARAAAPSLRRYREVRYEELFADPAGGLSAVFDFLDLETSPDAIKAVLREAGVAYNTDAQRPDIGAGKWRSEWTADDLAEFDSVAGDVLVDLGYPVLPAQRRRRESVRAGKWVSRLRRATRTRAVSPPRPVPPMELRQRRVDALCAALAAGDADAAVAEFTEEAMIRVVGPGQDEQGRAEVGVELLAKTLAADGGSWGQQRRGDMHVAETMFVVVLTHDGPGGSHDRLVVVHFDMHSHITGLTLYAFPL